MTLPARAAALGLALAAALGGCMTDGARPEAGARLVDVVDMVSADNTGDYTLTIDLGDREISETGSYRVAPDAAMTVRRDSADGSAVRYLRLTDDVYAEVPGATSEDGGRRCWIHGVPGERGVVAETTGGEVSFNTVVVEVVLSLANGTETKSGDLVAVANLRNVAAALGARLARQLDLPKRRIDVPVSLDVDDDGRITGWRVSMADVLRLSPGAASLGLKGDAADGSIAAAFTDPGRELTLSRPAEAAAVRADLPQEEIDAFAEACR